MKVSRCARWDTLAPKLHVTGRSGWRTVRRNTAKLFHLQSDQTQQRHHEQLKLTGSLPGDGPDDALCNDTPLVEVEPSTYVEL